MDDPRWAEILKRLEALEKMAHAHKGEKAHKN